MPTKKRVTVRNSETFRLKSKIVKDTFTIDVQLPPSYATSGRTYPTLYVTDGADCFDLSSGILHLLSLEDAVPEMIVVAIGYGVDNFDLVNNHRIRDYTPSQGIPVMPAGLPPAPPMGGEAPDFYGGGAPEFLAFIRSELIPRIETSYRANPEQRAYSGISLGGLFGAYVLFHEPDTFSRYLISSPSLWWGERVTLAYEQTYAQNHADLAARVYLSVGTWEEFHLASPGAPPPLRPLADWELEISGGFRMVSNLRELAAALNSRGYPSLKLLCREEEGGHTSSQPGAAAKGLMWLFQN